MSHQAPKRQVTDQPELGCDWTPWPSSLKRTYQDEGYWQNSSLHAALVNIARTHPDRIALIDDTRRWSYAELIWQGQTLASQLAARGICEGRYVVCHLDNRAEFFILLIACWFCGAVPIMAIASHRKREIDAYIEQSGAVAYFGQDSDFARRLSAKGLARYTLATTKDRSMTWHHDQDDTLLEVGEPLASHASLAPCESTFAGEHLALLQLSGGSTGTPKLIPRTHDDYLYSVRASIERCGFGPETRYFAVLPLTHNFCLSSPGSLGALLSAGTVVIGKSPQASVAFEQMQRHQANCTGVVPSVARMWSAYAEQSMAPTSLRHILIGGGPLDPQSAERTELALQAKVQQVYGMAEGLVCYTPLDAPASLRWHCQGAPMSPHDVLKIVDDQGEPCRPGEVGELWTLGPYTIRGYFRAPAHNAQAFSPDGFYKTGDLVRQGPKGQLQVCGRKKQQINRGGEKIASVEIEGLLRSHPKVRDVAVVGLPDPILGEKSCAVIVWEGQDDPQAIARTLRRFLRDQDTALFKIPDRFVRSEAIALSRLGKVDHNQVRTSLLA